MTPNKPKSGRVLTDLAAKAKATTAATAAAHPYGEPATDYEGADFRKDFEPCGIVTVRKNRREPTIAYYGEYNGKWRLHIRTIYQDDNEVWCPGKGISLPAEDAQDFATAIFEGFGPKAAN